MTDILIGREDAQKIANNLLLEPPQDPDFSYIIIENSTIETPKCFVFFYQSSKYLSSGRFEDRLVGNAPILVDRRSGTAHYLGTALDAKHYIRDFETMGHLPGQVYKSSGDRA